ncbi:GNAT family protein [Alkalihalophilus lindianensis]|uniref:GNAT family protein n=1 Tax=Alkalihalophilus lindianensis TaxID=1630542 RepID=A0ABU3XCM8_9BACI|nr:GNAT family protein [Alkalihalophilus lindianensis]MDV2685645.1 GNAT family protein [Alkalihalophilus lindianensis]
MSFIRIELNYFMRSHFEQLIHWIETPEFLLQWGAPTFTFPLDKEQLEKYLKDANNDTSSTKIYSVIEKGSGKVIGHIALGNIDRKNKSARVGKVLVGDKTLRGKGIGPQMMSEILKIAFNELFLHRVSLGVFDFNTSAIACYEKSGFIKEGFLRNARKNGEEYWSLWEMCILDNEWVEKN